LNLKSQLKGLTLSLYFQNLGEPIKTRRLEFELRPNVLEELACVLQLTRKAVDQYRAGDDRYSHLAESDIQKVQQTAELTHKWLEEKRATLAGTPRTQNPPVTVAQIRQEKQVGAHSNHCLCYLL
jgi:hypothetical protein